MFAVMFRTLCLTASLHAFTASSTSDTPASYVLDGGASLKPKTETESLPATWTKQQEKASASHRTDFAKYREQQLERLKHLKPYAHADGTRGHRPKLGETITDPHSLHRGGMYFGVDYDQQLPKTPPKDKKDAIHQEMSEATKSKSYVEKKPKPQVDKWGYLSTHKLDHGRLRYSGKDIADDFKEEFKAQRKREKKEEEEARRSWLHEMARFTGKDTHEKVKKMASSAHAAVSSAATSAHAAVSSAAAAVTNTFSSGLATLTGNTALIPSWEKTTAETVDKETPLMQRWLFFPVIGGLFLLLWRRFGKQLLCNNMSCMRKSEGSNVINTEMSSCYVPGVGDAKQLLSTGPCKP